ncbi:hypothetical protein CLHOM_32720 [Clostridium homopropionicum DSM 5847]|uniref:Transmembrane protein n=1 Tax=Clostridium homopropionicum DSM 5847 TaxID=1121318 RepID=A0A0L6Z5X5_9CLOT|nr:hypothetical protein [Clostridium homopropionicum]KOA18370.1 hypothetical protein CLHOM_32720 [Clostridium homopropionicum DSM 5847]SFF68282.1 hypothetical protein SAMN04488501_101208 [Clostridium homopropionicum]
MNINKAIRKQKRSFKRFRLSMCFIFFMLPVILYFTKTFSTFFLAYLAVIEILIIAAIIISLDKDTLKFEYNNKLIIQNGIFRDRFIILPDKVEVVHTLNNGKDLEIIIILKSRVRNKRIKKIDSKFLKKHIWAEKYYKNLMTLKENREYFYLIVNKGGYLKYSLLDLIYRYCVSSYFTEDAIKSIKEYRN